MMRDLSKKFSILQKHVDTIKTKWKHKKFDTIIHAVVHSRPVIFGVEHLNVPRMEHHIVLGVNTLPL